MIEVLSTVHADNVVITSIIRNNKRISASYRYCLITNNRNGDSFIGRFTGSSETVDQIMVESELTVGYYLITGTLIVSNDGYDNT